MASLHAGPWKPWLRNQPAAYRACHVLRGTFCLHTLQAFPLLESSVNSPRGGCRSLPHPSTPFT